MAGIESSGNNPRVISFKDPTGSLSAEIQINSPEMDHLTPAQRKSMLVTVQMFTAALYMAIDPQWLLESTGTTSDVLRHLCYRMGQVGSSMVERSISKDPEQVSPSPISSMRQFVKEITAASINTQTGIEAAKRRLVRYTETSTAIIDNIEALESGPHTKQVIKNIALLTRGMEATHRISQGMDEAISLILGQDYTVPPEIQKLTDAFGKGIEE